MATTETIEPQRREDPYDRSGRRKNPHLLEKDGVSPEKGGLRVGVQGGGCSGLSYAMRLDPRHATATRISRSTARAFFVDPKSLLYLNGTTLEYEETLMRQGFVVPESQRGRNCGCAAPLRPKLHRHRLCAVAEASGGWQADSPATFLFQG